MISAAICLALLTQPSTIDLIPTDDIWVYPHASDPSKDAYLRVWGASGKSVAGPGESIEEFSYSYLKWSLKDVPASAKVKGATLVLTHVANPEFTTEDVKANPVEVRELPASFSEKGWQYSHADKLSPVATPAGLFGTGGPLARVQDKETTFEIKLAKPASTANMGDFTAHLANCLASDSKELALALASKTDPSSGRGAVYKLFSKDGPKEFRPVLRITFEP